MAYVQILILMLCLNAPADRGPRAFCVQDPEVLSRAELLRMHTKASAF